MKRITSLIIAAMMIASLAACDGAATPDAPPLDVKGVGEDLLKGAIQPVVDEVQKASGVEKKTKKYKKEWHDGGVIDDLSFTVERNVREEVQTMAASTTEVLGDVSILWLGNSYIDGFKQNDGGSGDVFLSKVGISLGNFLKEYGDRVKETSPDIVICEFGTNEANYIDGAALSKYYGQLMEMLPDATFYGMLCPPSASSVRIDTVNEYICDIFGDNVIELPEGLEQYKAADGTHYTSDGYKMWYDYTRAEALSV